MDKTLPAEAIIVIKNKNYVISERLFLPSKPSLYLTLLGFVQT
jgi:hypothetical protein